MNGTLSFARSVAVAAGLAAAGLGGTPRAQACDLAEQHAALAEICEAALAEPAALLGALLPRLDPALREEVGGRLAAARALCQGADPALGAQAAARLARLAGRIEERLGEAPPIWPERRADGAR